MRSDDLAHASSSGGRGQPDDRSLTGHVLSLRADSSQITQHAETRLEAFSDVKRPSEPRTRVFVTCSRREAHGRGRARGLAWRSPGLIWCRHDGRHGTATSFYEMSKNVWRSRSTGDGPDGSIEPQIAAPPERTDPLDAPLAVFSDPVGIRHPRCPGPQSAPTALASAGRRCWQGGCSGQPAALSAWPRASLCRARATTWTMAATTSLD